MGTQRQRRQSPSIKNSMGTQLHPYLAGGSVEMPRSASGRRHKNVFPCDLTPILEILQRCENACGNATWYDSAFTYFQTHSAIRFQKLLRYFTTDSVNLLASGIPLNPVM